jgi:hypothetical protein
MKVELNKEEIKDKPGKRIEKATSMHQQQEDHERVQQEHLIGR